MTDLELRKLAKMIVQEQAKNSEWKNAFAKAQAQHQKPVETLVSAQKAATILGISVWQLYRIKDDKDGKPQFTYIKGYFGKIPYYTIFQKTGYTHSNL